MQRKNNGGFRVKVDLDDLVPIMLEAFDEGKTSSINVHGTSMRPIFNDSTVVELKRDYDIKKGDIVFYKREDGSYILHRVRRVRKDSYDIVGDHQYHIEHDVKKSAMIAKVVSYTNKNKTRYLNGFKYAVYKRLVRIGIIRYVFSKIF